MRNRTAATLTVVSCLGLLLARSGFAAEVKFEVPDAKDVQSEKAVYACGKKTVKAQYINAGSTSLALLSIGSEFIVASNVLSGSGARYAGGRYIWWTKGDHADLYDLMKGEDAAPIGCALKQ